MRALPLCLLDFSLTGCSVFQSKASITESLVKQPTPVITIAPRAIPVTLYKSAEELVGKSFRDLGEVSGESCQSTVQGSPPSIVTARKRMQTRASYMKANAVLLHECEIQSGVPGCHQQAMCQGSALNISSK
jgi:RcsF protein